MATVRIDLSLYKESSPMTSAILIALLITAVLPSIRFSLESNNQGSVTGSKLREIKRWLQYHSPEKKN